MNNKYFGNYKPKRKTSFLKHNLYALLALLLFSFYSATIYSQVSTYVFSENLLTYAPLTAPTNVAYSSPWDNHTTGAAIQVPIGFTFLFENVPYTDCYISPNGFITFGPIQPAASNYIPIGSSNNYAGAISAFGYDLVDGGVDIVYKTIGSAPNRLFYVQYSNVSRNVPETGTFNFQIRLMETSNRIDIYYGPSSGLISTTPRNVQVGLRGSNNNTAQGNTNNRRQVDVNTPWNLNSITGTVASNVMTTRNTSFPNPGLRYSWIPPVSCSTPVNQPTGLVIGSTSVTTDSFVGNSFAAATSNPSSYMILRSTDPTPPTAALFPDRTFFAVNDIVGGIYTVIDNTSNRTFTQTGLAPNTTYYYWVFSFNDNCFGSPFYNTTGILAGSQTTCAVPTVALAASSINGNGFDANWTPVPGATNYAIDVATDAAFTSIVPAYNNLLVGNVATFTVTGLVPLSTYYYRIRNVGTNCSTSSNTISVATPCGYFLVPYTQNFDTTTIPGLPICSTVANNNGDGVQWNTTNSNAASAPNCLRLNRSLTTTANDWFFIPGLQLTGGVSYRLFFRYNTNSSSTAENLRVRFGNAPTEMGMNSTIVDLPNIVNTIYQVVSVDFTPVSTGVYFIGFQGYSAANQNYILIDDISVTESPTCFEPSDITVASTGVTTASITWTASVPVPSNGYQYYLSTSSSTPATSLTPTGSVGAGVTTLNLSSLTPSTSYFIWVRGNCGGSTSIWSLVQVFSTDCLLPSVTASSGATRCGPGTLSLSATPNSGSSIKWYANTTATTPLGTGNNFVTPVLSATTTYYAQAGVVGGNVSTGPISPVAQGGAVSVETATTFVNFSVSANSTLQSFDIYPIASGQSGQFVLRNASNVILATYPFTTTFVGGTTPQTLPIGYALTPGNYSILIDIMPTSGLSINVSNVIYPYNSTVSSITGNGYDNNYYLYFYNWRFSTECLSPRVPVTATITTPPALSLSQSSLIICENDSSAPITVSGAASYNNFVWSPAAGVTGNATTGFIFNPTTTTNYVLTATQTSGLLCSRILNFAVTVNAAPSAIVVNPANTVVCENTILPLTSSLGASTEVIFYTENFEGSTLWTTTNSTGGGISANPAWTLQNSPYSYASPFWVNSFSSNDNSQFYFSNADSGGSGSFTNTTLESPAISLVGYTTANLNFHHYYRYVSSDVAVVQVSTNNGSTWTTVQQYLATQNNAPGTTTFRNSIVNLDAYVGLPSVKVRFRYQSNWGYGWAIDNITLRGTLALAVSWSPATELFTDVAATIPYVLGAEVPTVYARPTASRAYAATVVGGNGCTASAISNVTVDPNAIIGTMSADQTLCFGTVPTGVTISGYTGNIIRWESADDAAFTVNLTPIASTLPTLSSALMGVFTSVKFFRAVLTNGVCPPVFSNPVQVSYPSTTWNGTIWSNGSPAANKRVVFLFSGTYTVSSPMDACTVQILSGNVVVNPGVSLTVQGAVNVTAGTLTFENTASLIQVQNVANTGSITYKRNAMPMLKYDYTYWSSPVTNQNIRLFSPNTRLDKYFSWNTTIYNWSTIYALTNPGPYNTIMTPGIGYIIRAPDAGTPLFDLTTRRVFNGVFNGVPNNGPITAPIRSAGANKLNLIGNPYPSAINAISFINDPSNITTVEGTIYLWTHNTPITAFNYTVDDYATLNVAGSVGTGMGAPGVNNTPPGNFITAGQSFFINGRVPTGTATFRNSMRSANNSQFYRRNENALPTNEYMGEHHRFWLEISNEELVFKQTLLGYFQNATDGYESHYDGKLVQGGSRVNIYSFVENEKMCIQGLALPFDVNDVIPIGYSSANNETLTLKNVFQDGLFEGQAVYIEDKMLNVIHNLTESEYTFSTQAGTFDNRFNIKFTPSLLSNPTFEDEIVTDIKVFKSDDAIRIESTNTLLAFVKIYDIRGRMILQKVNINANNQSFERFNVAQQVLLVHVKEVNGTVTIRKIVY